MKNRLLNLLTSLFIFTMSLTFLISCGKSTEELIVGTWSGTDFTFDQTEGPDLAAMVEGGKGLHIDGKLILEATGTYIVTSPEDRMNSKGTWKVKGDELMMTDESNNEVIYTIVALDEAQLITSNNVKMESPLGNIAGTITLTYKK